LKSIGPDAISAVPTLEKFLSHEWYPGRVQAAEALWAISKDKKIVEPLLEVIKNSDDEKTVTKALDLFGKIGPSANSSLPDLKNILKNGRKPIQKSGVTASTVPYSPPPSSNAASSSNAAPEPYLDPSIRISLENAIRSIEGNDKKPSENSLPKSK
jgi:HEAT repeat protein